MRLVFLGPPGSGKGTQAKLLRDRYGLVHISTGDMIRERIAAGTPTGQRAQPYYERGELVPDGVIVDMVLERLGEPDCQVGFLLDGFPRTEVQAVALDQALAAAGTPIDRAILLVVEDGEIVRRLGGRRICAQCKEPYHEVFLPPWQPGRCDRCGGQLIEREDDRPETIRQRLRVYHRQTAEVAQHYRKSGILRVVPGMGSVEEIQARICGALEQQGNGR